MGYSALLFCPEEKTARTVTQVLSDLEFTVEACTEPFAAVKKLMSQHFDAVVVDCDNEQNATLLFKSARNSTSNQTSLAVAVVEGQAGVAKAFRIGANLVLTKPINIEQSKGTLRVARGLLRKGEPAKAAPPAAATPAPLPSVSKPVSAKKVAEPKAAPAVSTPPPMASPLVPESAPLPVPKPIPAWPAAAVASTGLSAHDDDLLEIDAEAPKKAAAPAEPHPAMGLFAEPNAARPKIPGTGAASAPAPAREPAQPSAVKHASEINTPTAAVMEPAPAATIGSAPSFTFGGMTDQDDVDSSGGSKKIFIGIAAALIVAGGIYWGVSHFRGSESQQKPDTASSAVPANVSQPAASTSKSAPLEKPSATLTPATQPNKIQSIIDETAGETHSATESAHKSSSESSEDSQPEPQPLMVKGGKAATRTKATADTAAPPPSMIGIAGADSAAPPAGLVPTTAPALRPTLSTVNVSQGVSTGLLIKKVAPSYPPNALRMHIEGEVELLATISKDGDITHIKVVSGNSQLTKAATDAVKQWKYKPYLLNGEPVEIQTQVTVRFKLPQ
jgi:periplasmic protein TonB